ncbi:PWI domain-containing protein [Trichoderma velutinum]
MASAGDARLMKSTKFPTEFSQKVDMQKVNLQVIKKWIANKISEILGSEDDVVIELCFNLIEGPRHPDIKSLQIQLTGFLDKDTGPFCKELWKLLLSAQSNPQGVPKELLEAKKLELMQEKIEADRAAETARKRRDDSDRRDREAVVGIGLLKAVEEEAMAGVQTDHVLPSLGTALLETHTGETAMFPELEVAEGATVDGSGDEVDHHLGQRQSDLGLQVALRLVAIEAPEALRAAKGHPHDIETRERDPGLLVAMLTDQGDSHGVEGIAVMLEIDAHNLQSAPHLHRSEDASLPPKVPL